MSFPIQSSDLNGSYVKSPEGRSGTPPLAPRGHRPPVLHAAGIQRFLPRDVAAELEGIQVLGGRYHGEIWEDYTVCVYTIYIYVYLSNMYVA